MLERVGAVLLHAWDPIGIAGEPAAADEYDAYAPVIKALLTRSATHADLIACLERIERDEMELDPPSGNAGRAAIELLSLLDP